MRRWEGGGIKYIRGGDKGSREIEGGGIKEIKNGGRREKENLFRFKLCALL